MFNKTQLKAIKRYLNNGDRSRIYVTPKRIFATDTFAMLVLVEDDEDIKKRKDDDSYYYLISEIKGGCLGNKHEVDWVNPDEMCESVWGEYKMLDKHVLVAKPLIDEIEKGYLMRICDGKLEFLRQIEYSTYNNGRMSSPSFRMTGEVALPDSSDKFETGWFAIEYMKLFADFGDDFYLSEQQDMMRPVSILAIDVMAIVMPFHFGR